MNTNIENCYRKENYCPYCNHHVDRAFIPGKEGAVPSVGDLSLCIRCADVSIFNKDLILEKFDPSTLSPAGEAHIREMQSAIKECQRRAMLK